MFTNQPFTENKAVINVKWYKYVAPLLSQDYIYQKIHPLRDAAFDADRRTSFKFKNRNSKSKKWILVMLSITVIRCTNIHILVRSPLKMKFLHLLWKFHGYIFNGLGEK